MRHLLVALGVVVATVSVVAVGCTQGAPTPAGPAQAGAPAKKVDFPAGGKSITYIVPYAPGGGTDIAARILSSAMEKELGTSIEIANKPGAGSQTGLTALVRSDPDGYTIGATVFPSSIMTYLDPERKAAFGRKEFQPVANFESHPITMSVLKSSPYQTVKDVIDAAKANPGKIRVGSSGLMTSNHLAGLAMAKAASVKVRTVHFNGDAEEMTALQGENIEVAFHGVAGALTHIEKIRVLGILDNAESKLLPGVKTMKAQGYDVVLSSTGGISAPAGTPREVVDILSRAVKKAMENEDYKKRMGQLGYEEYYLDPQQYATLWAEQEPKLQPMIELARAEQ